MGLSMRATPDGMKCGRGAKPILRTELRLAMSVTIYGIKNCDTMKKARAWLDGHDVAYAFHDYKASGIERKKLEDWVEKGRLGSAAQPRRHDLPRSAGKGQGRADRKEGDCADAGAALDDQAAGAGYRRQIAGRLQAGAIWRRVQGMKPFATDV